MSWAQTLLYLLCCVECIDSAMQEAGKVIALALRHRYESPSQLAGDDLKVSHAVTGVAVLPSLLASLCLSSFTLEGSPPHLFW
jgi:hypothetical protein